MCLGFSLVTSSRMRDYNFIDSSDLRNVISLLFKSLQRELEEMQLFNLSNSLIIDYRIDTVDEQ